MLGCQDFCGYYDWTFAYLRGRHGPEAVGRLWAEAIGGESQRHYATAAAETGLAGLYRTWTKTGVDEACDWTFTLDEDANALRWDMRQCPSKGFLLQNDLHADEDYCDHCMGWTIPLLAAEGFAVVAHEHNHCGQCWGLIGKTDRDCTAISPPGDITRDAAWRRGSLDRWQANRQQSALAASGQRLIDDGRPALHSADRCEVVRAWFAGARSIVVAEGPLDAVAAANLAADAGLLIADTEYVRTTAALPRRTAVLIRDAAAAEALAARWLSLPPSLRPLLIDMLLPADAAVVPAPGMPRPIAALPLVIRRGGYRHRSGQRATPIERLHWLAAALRTGDQ